MLSSKDNKSGIYDSNAHNLTTVTTIYCRRQFLASPIPFILVCMHAMHLSLNVFAVRNIIAKPLFRAIGQWTFCPSGSVGDPFPHEVIDKPRSGVSSPALNTPPLYFENCNMLRHRQDGPRIYLLVDVTTTTGLSELGILHPTKDWIDRRCVPISQHGKILRKYFEKITEHSQWAFSHNNWGDAVWRPATHEGGGGGVL